MPIQEFHLSKILEELSLSQDEVSLASLRSCFSIESNFIYFCYPSYFIVH